MEENIVTLIERVANEIQKAHQCKIERPSRYYLAYETYTIAYWEQIIAMQFSKGTLQEQERINDLLRQYGMNTIDINENILSVHS